MHYSFLIDSEKKKMRIRIGEDLHLLEQLKDKTDNFFYSNKREIKMNAEKKKRNYEQINPR